MCPIEYPNYIKETQDQMEMYAKAYVSQKTRDKMKESDFGDPANKKYPITDEAHYHAALRLVGRAPASEQAKIRKRIIEIGKRKGYKAPKADASLEHGDSVESVDPDNDPCYPDTPTKTYKNPKSDKTVEVDTEID